jgi:hypothetical protein
VAIAIRSLCSRARFIKGIFTFVCQLMVDLALSYVIPHSGN